MPLVEVRLFRTQGGKCPAKIWLDELERRDPRAYAVCLALIQELEVNGHEMERPASGFLRDGIYELRATSRNVQHRILYFFNGRGVAVLSHGLTKERRVPPDDIALAIHRKGLVRVNPGQYTTDW